MSVKKEECQMKQLEKEENYNKKNFEEIKHMQENKWKF